MPLYPNWNIKMKRLNLLETASSYAYIINVCSECHNLNLTGRFNLPRTALPPTLPGVHLGIFSNVRTAASARSGCGERMAFTLDTFPFFSTTNCTITKPSIFSFLHFGGYFSFFATQFAQAWSPPGNTGSSSITP